MRSRLMSAGCDVRIPSQTTKELYGVGPSNGLDLKSVLTTFFIVFQQEM